MPELSRVSTAATLVNNSKDNNDTESVLTSGSTASPPPWFKDELPEIPPFTYPEGYNCKHCNNTAIKANGKSCQTCYTKFAKQDGNIVVINPPLSTRKLPTTSKTHHSKNLIMSVLDPVPNTLQTFVKYGTDMEPLKVRPGDPAIGGSICGRCRGTGVCSSDLMFEKTCTTCKGLGRLI